LQQLTKQTATSKFTQYTQPNVLGKNTATIVFKWPIIKLSSSTGGATSLGISVQWFMTKSE